jgi:Zn-dependent alcohol dehydrogenase
MRTRAAVIREPGKPWEITELEQNLCDWGAQMMTGMLADGTFRFHDDDGADLGGFCMLGTFAERAVVSQNSCVPMSSSPRDTGSTRSTRATRTWMRARSSGA